MHLSPIWEEFTRAYRGVSHHCLIQKFLPYEKTEKKNLAKRESMTQRGGGGGDSSPPELMVEGTYYKQSGMNTVKQLGKDKLIIYIFLPGIN